MPSYDKRLSKLEDAFIAHITESGEIRSDLKWLKKFLWFVLGSPVVLELVRYFMSLRK